MLIATLPRPASLKALGAAINAATAARRTAPEEEVPLLFANDWVNLYGINLEVEQMVLRFPGSILGSGEC